MFPQDIWVLVPHPNHDAVLVVETDAGPSLPTGHADRDDDTGRRLAAVTKPWGIDSPFLRRVAEVEVDGRELLLKEFEAVPAAGRRWLPLTELDRLRLPEQLRPALARWVEYQRGRPYPRYRTAWSRPGWLARTRNWLTERLAEHGIEPVGPPSVVQQWAISAVLRQPTRDHGDYYLKAVFGGPGRGFWHEPALSAALAREHPAAVPQVTVIDSEQGLMVMPDMGVTLLGDGPPRRWEAALATMGRIQRAWVGRREELLALGCPQRGGAATAEALESAFDDPRVAGRMSDEHRARVEKLLPRWRELCVATDQWPVPSSLVHGDYHAANVGLRDDGGVCAFDWSDGAWGQPLTDAVIGIRQAGEELAPRLWDGYLEHWSDFAPMSELRRLIPAVRAFRMLYGIVTYQGIMDNVDPDDRFVFADWADTYWRMAAEAWDAYAG